MPSLDLLLAFAAATAIFAYMPGPAMLYAAAQTMARGRRGGVMAVIGIHCGGYVHVLGAVFGLSALFELVPPLYLAVKLGGALYLIWLGLSLILRRQQDGAAPQVAPASARRAFIESIVVEVLNPKAAIFFLAFLPQFVDPAAAFPVWLQFLLLGTTVNLVFSSADIATVLLADRAMAQLRGNQRMQRLIRWCGGAILIGLGIRLATARGS
jgi:threonine/homoserine/homoserine lactone efflux protein